MMPVPSMEESRVDHLPVPSMEESSVDHRKRFQAAVDVIHNLPKNGSYQPSYNVMLRFYSLYKQAVCGPCTVSRPGFWDPVGRYKWDAWSRLGEMSSDSAMAAYVDEMKKVAQEVINTMPMNEKTASMFQHFEPLYLVIDDMPRPPHTLLGLGDGVKGSEQAGSPEEEGDRAEEEVLATEQELSPSESSTVLHDSRVCEGVALTSDSESEVFCDSVDSVEQLGSIKVEVIKSNGLHNGQVYSATPYHLDSGAEARQVGAGHGGEGAEDGIGQGPVRRSRNGPAHNWRERGVPQGSPRQPAGGAPMAGSGAGGRGGGAGSEGGASEGGAEQLQQLIILALRRLREDMRSVMDRLEALERLTATHAQSSDWRPCLQCAAAAQDEGRWWPFDVSGRTVLLFLLWPLVAQGLLVLLRKAQRPSRISS